MTTMHPLLQTAARDHLKKWAKQLTHPQAMILRRMYAPDNLDIDLRELIDDMPEHKLNIILYQVERSVVPDEVL